MKTEVVKLTPEERELVIQSVRRVWNEIYCDACDLFREDGRDWARRSEVAELCFDASRPVTIGHISPELYHKVCMLSEADRKRLEKDAFPLAKYGV